VFFSETLKWFVTSLIGSPFLPKPFLGIKALLGFNSFFVSSDLRGSMPAFRGGGGGKSSASPL